MRTIEQHGGDGRGRTAGGGAGSGQLPRTRDTPGTHGAAGAAGDPDAPRAAQAQDTTGAGDAALASAVQEAAAAAEPHPAARALRRRRADRLRASLRARRARLRADPHAYRLYRTAVGVVGGLVVLLGLVLVPLPGPGWLVVFLGLALLGTEFRLARRLLHFARRHVDRWTRWVAGRSWGTRIAMGSATAAVGGLLVYGYLAAAGVPGWVPEQVTAQLVLVPGVGG
ncbi:TIGR02611 family protein [Kineococcus sp. SYSU DK004]|uniref:TIGR02611 family protein n=1 Tax=Kineococcus sp. SYSU DK004 TaxID=3383125 RepID=UPI003D7ED25D